VFVGLALAVVLATSLTNGVPGERWIDFALLNVQPSHVPTNVAAYCLGLAASLGGWLDAPAGRRALWRRALVAIALGTAYVAAAAFGHPATHPPMQPLYLGLRCVFSVALLALVLELAALLRDRRLPLGRALSPLSYSLYLLHLVPVLALGLALRDWPVHPVLKVVLVTLGALVSSWLAGAALLRTPARRLLGG
jgi:peptidoglycan/LPS O-acetylase OafA/YrhL